MNRLLSLTFTLLSLLYAGCSSKEVLEAPKTAQTSASIAGANTVGTSRPTNYEVALVVDLNSMNDSAVSAAWMGYLTARDMWINENITDASPSDFRSYTPPPREELAGRKTLAQLWKSIRASNNATDDYLDSLILISDAGYIEPYVWQYHYQSTWGPRPSDLPWTRFSQWMNQRLPEFSPETRGSIQLMPPGATAQAVKDFQPTSIQAAN
ncbi:hypothetical protein [Cerasicoccus arenae]|uniref:Uncharacterized protein n=1 Tax=Cerasicoccus arenae TaxID=424488 RepID=A0A8J3GED6_9BACT|nr:hypothetical protein [Cerasicoccus arenae]MBK1859455.1 hypothetical protein [Cerasicoccus arenae]GHC13658.1 hypothetical protein GCM10007047_33740 [Cerasicoccus arenae]